MAEVYRAHHEYLRCDVAIKVPAPQLGPETLDRFVQEARTMAKVRHPHVCPIYDAGVIDGIYYLVMALVKGGTLADVIAGGPLPEQEAARITYKLANALAEVHRAGILHRDIKPSNVMLEESGEPLLMDFGIARLAEDQQQLAVAGGIAGTPAYMPLVSSITTRSLPASRETMMDTNVARSKVKSAEPSPPASISS
jgi:serine/threonine protein kinase